MVSMYDIELNGDIGFARCIPEQKKERTFEVEFNVHTYEILSLGDPEERCYAGHAVSKLCRIFRETGSLPETAESWWV